MPTKVNRLPKSEIEIEGELPSDLFETYYTKALQKLGENLELPGFRKGKAPESVILANIGEMRILEQMAEMALAEHYPKIIDDEKLDVITPPAISITKLARNNPLGFKIKTAVLPEIKLPDYKKLAQKISGEIAKEVKDLTATDAEVEATIMDIRKSRAAKKHMAEPHVHKEGEVHSHDEDLELPEFNDEFVKALGPFENIADFKEKLKINIKLEKENQEREKKRLKIIEKIIEETGMDLPEILIGVELDKILYRMESDITAMGLKFEDYLKHLNKTREDLRKEFRPDAEKKAKLSLVLHEIAKAEKITADPAKLELEVTQILAHYKDADPERAKMHAENVLVNEAVFQVLEAQ